VLQLVHFVGIIGAVALLSAPELERDDSDEFGCCITELAEVSADSSEVNLLEAAASALLSAVVRAWPRRRFPGMTDVDPVDVGGVFFVSG